MNEDGQGPGRWSKFLLPHFRPPHSGAPHFWGRFLAMGRAGPHVLQNASWYYSAHDCDGEHENPMRWMGS